MRMTALMARRILAGALLGVVMTLSLAGIASAQSNSGSNSASNSSTGSAGSSAGTGTTGGAAGGTGTGRTAGSTARTGAEMWIPLMLGGLVITIAVATRAGLSRAASRTP